MAMLHAIAALLLLSFSAAQVCPNTDCSAVGRVCEDKCCSKLQCVTRTSWQGNDVCLACASAGDQCEETEDCCEGTVCSNGACMRECAQLTEWCVVNRDCCDDGVCIANACEKPCGFNGTPCDDDSECCANQSCKQQGSRGGRCRPGECGANGDQCLADGDCCDGNCFLFRCLEGCTPQNMPCPEGAPECCNERQCVRRLAETDMAFNQCVRCAASGDECFGPDQKCCKGLSCDANGICRADCALLDLACSADEDCCGDLGCEDGTCKPNCSRTEETCSDDDDCCNGLFCVKGKCTFQESCGDRMMYQSFDQYPGPPQNYTVAMVRADFPFGVSRLSSFNELKKGGFTFSKGHGRGYVGNGMLRNTHPQGGLLDNESGFQFDVRFDKPVLAATLSYHFRFQRGYDFTAGGKMPGLCGEACPSGCSLDETGSFNARLMWRDEEDNSNSGKGLLETYMYYPQRENICGDDWIWPGQEPKPGQWQFVQLYIRLNDIGKANGEQIVWLDGRRVYERKDIVYRLRGEVLIERFTGRNFHGGSIDTFRPSQTQYMWFDDFKVQEGMCPEGLEPPRPARPPVTKINERRRGRIVTPVVATTEEADAMAAGVERGEVDAMQLPMQRGDGMSPPPMGAGAGDDEQGAEDVFVDEDDQEA